MTGVHYLKVKEKKLGVPVLSKNASSNYYGWVLHHTLFQWNTSHFCSSSKWQGCMSSEEKENLKKTVVEESMDMYWKIYRKYVLKNMYWKINRKDGFSLYCKGSYDMERS